jgi:hyperosmotically inducible protein
MTRTVMTLVTAATFCGAVAIATPGFAQTPAATAPAASTASNDQLEDLIEKKWEADATLKDADIDVSVAAGVATLTGEVPTAALKSRAARLAKIDGVTRVENQITIQRPSDVAAKTQSGAEKAANKTAEGVGVAAGETKRGAEIAGRETKKGVEKAGEKTAEGVGVAARETKNAAKKTGEVVSDSWITTKVKTKFVGEDALKHSHISVSTKDNVVTLTGTVASEAGRERAIAIVKATDGVKDVVDKLTIAPGKTN